jgi:hypothetical protein
MRPLLSVLAQERIASEVFTDAPAALTWKSATATPVFCAIVLRHSPMARRTRVWATYPFVRVNAGAAKP